MPEKQTVQRAKRSKREGRSAGTQAGEFVREEMRHIRQGRHGSRSTKQAITIGLSKARRAGVALPPPKRGRVSEKSRRSPEARTSNRRVEASPFKAVALRGKKKFTGRTLGGGSPSSADQGSCGAFSRRTESGARSAYVTASRHQEGMDYDRYQKNGKALRRQKNDSQS
jgi:hypothetical protein